MFQRQPPEVTIAQLAAASGCDSFGGWITAVKKKYTLTQATIARSARRSFEAAQIKPGPSAATIGRLERNDPDRFPRFRELEPLYRAFVESSGLNLPLSIEERELYLHFARERIEQRRRKEQVSAEQWEDLADRLLLLTPNPRSRFHLVRAGEQKREERSDTLPQGQEEDPNSRRKRAIRTAKDTDLRLFLEREEWVKRMLSYPEMTPQMKLVVVQAGGGAGKSYAAAFLLQHLEKQEQHFLIPYLFETGNGKTPEDQLDEFLATALADLTFAKGGDEGKQRPLETRIDQFFAELHKRTEKQQKVIFVLDNAHLIFSSAGTWSSAWSAFLAKLARDSHTATMYLFTRVWPGWDHPQTFVERTDLPPLSALACVSIWHHFRFGDVPQDVLEKISARCGNNPQFIELLVAQCQSSMFGVRWGSHGTTVSASAQSPNTQKLEALLAQDSIFELRVDAKTRAILQSAMSSELSHQAKAMLECLAASPLGLPIALLAGEFVGALDALDALDSASVLDLSMASSNRAAVVPFVREAVLLALAADGRRDAVESRTTDLYAYWLSDVQDFKDDREKAALIAEMVVRYIRSRRLLDAADLFVGFGWLCTLFGQMSRIQRVFEEVIRADRGKVEDVQHEVGRLLLRHHIGIKIGKGISVEECDRIYLYMYDKVLVGEVTLDAHTAIDVLCCVLLAYLDKSQFDNASNVLEETRERLQKSGQLTPEIHASFLGNKARLFARWWDDTYQADQDRIRQLQQECLIALKESIVQWRLCLKNALPLQEHYYHFKMARMLNDYAYRCRLAGNLVEAESAIEESLRLKKAGGALPHSLAISLSEHSQILALQGKLLQALTCNEQACTILANIIEEGDTSFNPEFGMLLIERADILKQQACLKEARNLLERGIPLIRGVPSRKRLLSHAEKELVEISLVLESGQLYQLDRRWFSQYLKLVRYDDLAWVEYTGPFTEAEQQEWEQLFPRREEADTAVRMTELVLQARRREFASSQKEKRAPVICYPCVPLDDVLDLVTQFENLQREIKAQEKHAIVRSLYVDVIDEHIAKLRLCEAIAQGNRDAIWQYNLSLYGKPTQREVFVALQSLCEMVLEAQNHETAGPVAEDVLHQLQSWGLAPHDIAAMEFFPQQEPTRSFDLEDEREFAPTVVQHFLQSVLTDTYHADGWVVEIAPARDMPYIDANLKKLCIPSKPLTLHAIREFLAEEIEVHAYRSISGLRSPLAILGSGLAGYLVTEEGLADYYFDQISSDERNKWVGTVSVGLASGILTHPLSFYELATFLEKTFLISKLLKSKSISSWDDAIANARQRAWARAARTFRGIPHLAEAGYCSLRDVVYLRGFLAVKQELEQVSEERFMVGKVGIQHLGMMDELNIVAPFYPNHHLALTPALLERVSKFEE